MADPGGRNRRPPLKLDQLWVFYNPFCIRMLKNGAQIALESIKKKPRASRALKRALDPCRQGTSDFALVICVRACNLLRPPPPQMKILNPPLYKHLILLQLYVYTTLYHTLIDSTNWQLPKVFKRESGASDLHIIVTSQELSFHCFPYTIKLVIK